MHLGVLLLSDGSCNWFLSQGFKASDVTVSEQFQKGSAHSSPKNTMQLVLFLARCMAWRTLGTRL